MFLWFHKLGSPPHFYRIAGKWIPWLNAAFALLLLAGLYGGLIQAPPDYQQGESYRIIFVHVPSAWMSLFIYVVMAFCGVVIIVWRMKLAEVVLISSAPIGASFTFLALVTGALWGKPMWGTYWVWDARLTSELILLFLYLGVMALQGSFEDRRTGSRAAAVLETVLAEAPRAEVPALILADAALAQALGWDRLLPLLAALPGLPAHGVRQPLRLAA